MDEYEFDEELKGSLEYRDTHLKIEGQLKDIYARAKGGESLDKLIIDYSSKILVGGRPIGFLGLLSHFSDYCKDLEPCE